MVSGETHYVEGRRYRLDVVERDGAQRIRIARNGTLELGVRPGSDRAARETVLYRWYRRRLRAALPNLVAKWAPAVGVEVAEVRIRRMDALMPSWRVHRDELNRAPLAHEDWGY